MAPSKNNKRKVGSDFDGGTNKRRRASTTNSADHDSSDDDEELPNNFATYQPTWRLDPKESLSDWTIKIVWKPVYGDGKEYTKKTNTYHVHKATLAAGSRKSEYFCRLFQNGFAESQPSTSQIELHHFAARAFPDLLDYMYTPQSKLKVSTASATALHYLGQYFEMRCLRWDAKQFWQNDMDANNCDAYYEHSKIFRDEKIQKAAAKVFAENIQEFNADSWLIDSSDPELWIQILQSRKPNTLISVPPGGFCKRRFDEHVSVLIAESCSRQDGVDAATFKQLIDEKYMECISFANDTHLKFLEIEQKLLKPNNPECLTSLQKRCAQSLADGWEFIKDEQERDKLLAAVEKQGAAFATEVLSKTLEHPCFDGM